MGIVQRAGAFMSTVSHDKREPPNPDAFIRDYKELTQAPPSPLEGETGLRTRLWYNAGRAVAKTMLWIDCKHGRVRLHDITSIVRGQGYGTRVLVQLTTLADKHRMTITGLAKETEGGPLNSREVKAWLCRHGFKLRRDGTFVYRGLRFRESDGSYPKVSENRPPIFPAN